MDCPFTKRTEYQLLTADADTVEDSLKMQDDGVDQVVAVLSACGMEKIVGTKKI